MDLRLWDNYPELQTELLDVEKLLLNQIKVDNPDFEAGIDGLIKGNGKMIRAALLLLAADFGPGKNQNQRYEKAAASIEVVHLASLVHDDVIDASDLRRGKTSLNSAFGSHDAVYLGDYLFTQYFELLLQYAPNFDNLKYSVKAMEGVLKGELEQSVQRYDVNRTADEYLASISGKTARLFRFSMGEGAIVAGGDEQLISLMEEIGENIGMAFQIRDDLLDFEPDQEKSKPTLNDVSDGVYTLPVIEALLTPEATDLKPLLKKKEVSKADLEKIRLLIVKGGGIKAAQNTLNQYVNQVDRLIAKLPDTKKRTTLKSVVRQLFH